MKGNIKYFTSTFYSPSLIVILIIVSPYFISLFFCSLILIRQSHYLTMTTPYYSYLNAHPWLKAITIYVVFFERALISSCYP